MTNIMFIGDPHIRHTHLKEGADLLAWIESVADEHRPDLIVNLGDTLDTHSIIRSEVLSLVNSHVRRVVDMKIPMVMVLGNHDMWKPNCSKFHALEVFKGIKGITVADSVVELDGVTYVPYLPDLSDWPEIKTSIAVTHNTFLGADYGFTTATRDCIDIDATVFLADIVVSGHIHKRQSLRNGSIIYPGTPTSLTASDANQTKGLMFLNTQSLLTKFVESPFPIWRSIDVEVHEAWDLKINTADRWIVRVTGPRAEIRALLESKYVEDLRRQVQISFRTQFTDAVKTSRAQIVAPTVYSMAEQYIDRVYDGALDREKLKNTVRRYTERS